MHTYEADVLVGTLHIEVGDAVALAVECAIELVGVITHRSPGTALEVDVSGELGIVLSASAVIHLLSEPEELAAVADGVVAIGFLNSRLVRLGASSIGAEAVNISMGMSGRTERQWHGGVAILHPLGAEIGSSSAVSNLSSG